MDSQKEIRQEELRHLDMFCGTEEYHRVQKVGQKPVYATDGIKYLCEKGACYWLMDLIVSHQFNPNVRKEEFQVWTLTVKDDKATAKCDDGNGHILATQQIQYTDFPLSEIKIYLQCDDEKIVIMLPSEY